MNSKIKNKIGNYQSRIYGPKLGLSDFSPNISSSDLRLHSPSRLLPIHSTMQQVSGNSFTLNSNTGSNCLLYEVIFHFFFFQNCALILLFLCYDQGGVGVGDRGNLGRSAEYQ